MAQNNVSRSKFVTALRTLYRYDKDTGNLIDKVTGEALGTPNATGTLRCCFLGEATTVSRLVWMYHFGKAPTGRVWSILNKKGLRTQTTNGHLVNCTKIEYLYDSGSRRSGRDAPNPDHLGWSNFHLKQLFVIFWKHQLNLLNLIRINDVNVNNLMHFHLMYVLNHVSLE